MAEHASDGGRHLTRRRVVLGSAAVLAGVGGVALYRAGNPPAPGAADRKAVASGKEEALYNRGLVPVAQSGWTMPEGVHAPWPALDASLDADVVVVGAGLAGSSTALHLAARGVNVVVLEARQPGWGASGRNAGHVLPTLRDLKLFERFPDEGKAFFDAFRAHHTIPYDLSAEYGIDCDAVRSGYVNGLTSARAFGKFAADNAWIEKMGMGKVRLLQGADALAATGSRHYTHAVVYEDGGRVNPYLLTNGMINAAANRGARIFGDSAALAIAPEGKRWRVRTAQGDVLAQKVVFCTAAYPTDVVPAFERAFFPLTAWALTTKPLPADLRAVIMPGGATLAEAPVDLHPMVKDRHGRLILSSLPTSFNAADRDHHFRGQIAWLNKVWPETRGADIQLETFWTGRVAMRREEFPGAYRVAPGLYGLMHFNAWGNVMAPLMGKLLAEGLADDRPDRLPFPLETPEPVAFQGKIDLLFRDVLLPAARTLRRVGVV